MALQDWDGTTAHDIFSLQDWDGTAAHNIYRVEDFDGMAAHDIWLSERNILAEKWREYKSYSSVGAITQNGNKVAYVEWDATGGYVSIYIKVNFSDYKSLKVTCSGSGSYNILSFGITDGPTNQYPKWILQKGGGNNININETIDISNITGEHYLCLHCYAGSIYGSTTTLSQCILE